MFVIKQRLASDSQTFTESLRKLDLEPIAYKLMHSSQGKSWTRQETTQAIASYLNFLSLIYLYPNLPLVPTQEIDQVWHHHILDTSKYAQDCQMLFGRFIHHFPYFGLCGERDQQNWQAAAKQTQALFQQHFAGDAMKFVNPADCQPLGFATNSTHSHSNLAFSEVA